ncbi:MAG: SDR family NAD(P)-dependent oxidoreductase [Pseudobdellovibrio sp.]
MTNNKRFQNKVVLVTGASSGIGEATAKAFAAEGANLIITARRLDKLNEVAKVCRSFGVSCEVVVADLQDYSQILKLASSGEIDILINNAGMGYYGKFSEQKWSDIKQTLHTNLEAVLALTHAVIPQMIKRRSGVIVNVSSVLGKRPFANLATYCASKFALWGFSDSLRMEVKDQGIHVCHFCPTSTDTGFQKAAGMQAASNAESSEKVALALVNAVAQRKDEHIMSLTERVFIKLTR